MKHHSKTYEDVFSSDPPKSPGRLNFQEVSAEGMSVNEYVDLFRSFLGDFYKDLFLVYVRLSWLRRSFSYYGHKTILPMQKNHMRMSLAFVKFLRRYVGKDIQMITKGGSSFSKIELYFDEMFPGFLEGNPFENPEYYRFPFKNISMDYLVVVHQLDERMELLKYADDNKMSFAVFLDYVINHVSCENDDLGRTRYTVNPGQSRYQIFVRDTDKKLSARRRKK